jgi:hypothetical protein
MKTEQISGVVLVGLVLFGFLYLPGVQYLVSLAIAAVSYGITESLETAVVTLIVGNIVLSMIFYNQMLAMAKMEGFVGTGGNVGEIAKRIVKMRTGSSFNPGGVSDVSEGFEDANQTDMTLSNPEKKEVAAPATATSQPAQANAADAAAQMTAMMNGLKGLAASNGAAAPAPLPQVAAPAVATPAAPSAPVPVVAPTGQAPAAPAAPPTTQGQMPQAAPPAAAPQVSQGFKGDANQDSLFKLGAMPMDSAGGYHIDAGTTVMNALKSLKPEQIKAMTADTKQLVETQKSLMDMLQSFRPIISEGKEMMETFSQMFK